jgi:hypothetical protein
MRKLAAAFVFIALVALISAQQRATIRWEPTGGPLVAQQKQIIVQRGRLLLVGTGGQWWRSPDRGKSWKAFEQGTPRPWIVAANQRTLFGDAIDGVVRSSDMGDSWTQCGAVPVNRRTGNEVTSIAADESRVYVSIFRIGLFRSDDQCATWMPLATPWKLEFPPSITYANRSRVIVRALGGSFLSIDAGRTWTPSGAMLPDPLALTTGCNGVIVAGTGRGVFVSRDDGRSWAPLGLEGRWVPAVAAPRCDEVFAVVQDSGLWTHSVFRSTDGGANWALVNGGLSGHPLIGLTTDGDGETYAAGSSGAFQWSDNEWQQIGPPDITVTSVVVAPWGEVFAAGGWMGLFASRAIGEPWRRLLIGHDAHVSPHSPPGGGASVVFFTPKADILAATHGGGVLRSRDHGRTWRFVGLSRTVHSFVSTPNGAFLAGTENGIFRSVDDGESWIERSIGLTAFRIYCLAVATDGTAYAGTWEGPVFRSTDEGDRWRPMAGPRGGNPVHALVALKNGDVLAGGHAGLSRWNRSSQSWQPIPLPTQRGRSFVRALMQDNAGVIFAGTEGDGVFASFDEGNTWQATNDGLTVNRVFALGLDGAGHVVAGTSAGVFRGANVPAHKQVGGD